VSLSGRQDVAAAAAAAGAAGVGAFSRTLVCDSPVPPHAADTSRASAADCAGVTDTHTHTHTRHTHVTRTHATVAIIIHFHWRRSRGPPTSLGDVNFFFLYTAINNTNYYYYYIISYNKLRLDVPRMTQMAV